MPELSVVLPRKVVTKVQSQTPKTGAERGREFTTDNVFDPNLAITNYRTVSDPAATLRNLYRVNGLVSSVITSLVGMANSEMRFMAYETGTHQFSEPGMLAAEQLLSRWETVWDYTVGYADRSELSSLRESCLLEIALTGGIGAELVLDKQRFPDRLQLFPYDTIRWKANGQGGRFPSQDKTNPKPGEEATQELNLPTIWVGESLKALNLVYNLSFLASGFKQLFHYEEFIQDMRKVVRSSGGPRVVVTLSYQKAVQAAPPEVQKDPSKLVGYLEEVRGQIETILKALEPQDALVVYDIATVDSMATSGEKADYKNLLDAMSGLTASAMKSNPSILGLRLGGSQNVSSTESMLFMKIAKLVQKPTAHVLSRAMTLGCRLMGFDVYVKAAFDGVDLRPELELESHRSIKQNRVLELLSFGFYSDAEAAALLGTGARPAGAPQLSGTFFYETKAPSETPTPNSDPNGRQISSNTPTSGGGRDND